MKALLKKLCSPLLVSFEKGEGEYVYKDSHRKILIIMGLLFLAISLASLFLAIKFTEAGGIIPIVVFLGVGLVCEIVGFLGSDRAVSKIWKNK
ncbi:MULTISPECIES: hypothetical protein [Marinomonas]|uniref:hypothetical protein n=1 Tax=Marinomonas TaxID=28253 RepID=UPI00105638B7|nr:hypothetical protein [Marinomonas flavescens]